MIATYMSRQDWQGKKFLLRVRAIFFNYKLFVGQLMFMIAGTIIGKIRETCDEPAWPAGTRILILNIFGLVFLIAQGIYWYIPLNLIGIIIGLIEGRGMIWRRVWRAAQVSHVRLCLSEPDSEDFSGVWLTANFGYPKMEIQPFA